MITRVFNIMLRNGHFIEAPEILANQEIEIEYISSMALSQKASQLSGIMRGMEVFGSLAQVAPVMDFLNSTGLVKELIKILGLPATMINSDAEVEQIRAERQEQQAQQAEMQQAMQEAQVAKDAAPMVQQLNEATKQQA
jgi:reverse gyrase